MIANLARPEAGSSSTSLILPRLSPCRSLTLASMTWLITQGWGLPNSVAILCFVAVLSASKQLGPSEPPTQSAIIGTNVFAFMFDVLVFANGLLYGGQTNPRRNS